MFKHCQARASKDQWYDYWLLLDPTSERLLDCGQRIASRSCTFLAPVFCKHLHLYSTTKLKDKQLAQVDLPAEFIISTI